MAWNSRVKVKHLFTKNNDHESVQTSVNAIADVLEETDEFCWFDADGFRDIPKGDSFFGPADYANRLLEKMYDYADEHRIWVE